MMNSTIRFEFHSAFNEVEGLIRVMFVRFVDLARSVPPRERPPTRVRDLVERFLFRLKVALWTSGGI